MLFSPTTRPSNDEAVDVLGFLVVSNRQVHSYQTYIVEAYLESLGMRMDETGIPEILAGHEGEASLDKSLAALDECSADFIESLYRAMVIVSAVDGLIDPTELEILDKVAARPSLDAARAFELRAEAISLANEYRVSSNGLFVRKRTESQAAPDTSFSSWLKKAWLTVKSWFSQKSPEESEATPEIEEKYAKAISRCAVVAKEDFELLKPVYERVISSGSDAVTALNALADSLPKDTDLAAGTSAIIGAFAKTLRDDALRQVTESQCSLEQKERTVGDFTISLMGRTKAGKSTLHAILSDNGLDDIGSGSQRTTRYNRVYQWNMLRLIDTPGIGSPEAAGRTDDEIAESILGESDVICIVVVDDSVTQDVLELIGKVAKRNKPVIVLLNHKENIEAEVKFRRHLAHPTDWLTSEGEARLSGHIDRIKRFAAREGFESTVHVYPVFLLAARMAGEQKYAEHQDLLWESSNIDLFIDDLSDWITSSGTIKRSQTILDEASCLLSSSYNQIQKAKRPIDDEISSINEQRKIRLQLLDETREKAATNIRKNLTTMFGDLATNEALAFAEEVYEANPKELEALWRKYLKRIGFEENAKCMVEAELSTYQKKASDAVDDLFEDCFHALKTSFSIRDVGIPVQVDLRSIARLVGSGIGVVGAILAALSLAGPVGAVIGIVGGVMTAVGAVVGFGSNLLMSKAQRRAKAVEGIYSKLKSEITAQAPSLIEDVVQSADRKMSEATSRIGDLYALLSDGLQESSNVARSLLASYKEQIDCIDKAYATRLVEFIRNGDRTSSGVSPIEILEVDRSQPGTIRIKCEVAHCDASALEGIIAEKVVVE